MCEYIKITKEDMWSRRFEDFRGSLDTMDNDQLVYIIRQMLKYIDRDKKYVWIMHDKVETRLLNRMIFPEIIINKREISYLFGYPVKCKAFLSVEKNKDSDEERGEIIAYPYIWLKEYNADIDGETTSIDEYTFMKESYIRVDNHMQTIDFMIGNMGEVYRRVFNANHEEVDEYKEKLRAHLRQFL